MDQAVAKDSRELASSLWRGGLFRIGKHFPAWTVAEPEFHDAAVVFVMANGAQAVRVRVEGHDAPGTADETGPNLRVVTLDDGGAPDVANALAKAIVAVDRAGRAMAPPPYKQPVDGSWRELFIADTCNLKCSFCCEAVRIGRGSMMEWSVLEQTLHRYAESGVKVVQFMGGEPSLHPRFADALRLSRQLGMRNYAITNLLQWRKPAFAEEVGPLLDELMISMHAVGEQAGESVTGRRTWWDHFQVAVENARTTLACRVYGATVLSKHNVGDLERIAETLVSLGARKWVMGNSVPINEAPLNSLEINLELADQRAEMGRFRELHAWTAERGCEMVFFCMPDCVLSPELWPASHDRMLHDQDLLGTAAKDDVTFWSRTDFQEETVRNVALGRRYSEGCDGCVRKGTCGGYFQEYLDARGGDALRPMAELPVIPSYEQPRFSAVHAFQRALRVPGTAYELAPTELDGRALRSDVMRHGARVGSITATPGAEPDARTIVRFDGDVPSDARQHARDLEAGPLAWPSRIDERPMMVVGSGVPRSGTSWLTRTAHGLLRASGATVHGGGSANGQAVDDFPSNAPGDEHARRLDEFVRSHAAAPSSTHCVKTHYDVGHVVAEHPRGRMLYIYRDPRDVLASTFHYAFAGPASGHFAALEPAAAFERLLHEVVPVLRASLEAASADSLPQTTLLVRYDDLVERPEGEIRRLARHLGVHLPTGFDAAAAQRYRFERETGRARGAEERGSYWRSGLIGAWRDALPASFHAPLEAALPDADALLAALDARRVERDARVSPVRQVSERVDA